MKRITAMAAAAAIAMTATGAIAQTVSQTAVLGESGVAGYPLQIQGSNGVIYNCEAAVVDGTRTCIRGGGGASLFGEGAGLGTGAAVGAAALVLVIVAANSDDDAVSTTTTN